MNKVADVFLGGVGFFLALIAFLFILNPDWPLSDYSLRQLRLQFDLAFGLVLLMLAFKKDKFE